MTVVMRPKNKQRCSWCDDPLEPHQFVEKGGNYVREYHGRLYHHDCLYDALYESRQEQYMKHAPDNM